MTTLKDKVIEIVGIAKECPENLQAICFELLLKDHLDKSRPKTTKPDTKEIVDKDSVEKPDEESNANGSKESLQDDISERELHPKAKAFMSKRGITVDHINNLFYKEDGKVKPLFDNLKTNRMAEGQIRLALIQAFRNSLLSGEFAANVEDVRNEAADRKYLDPKNFTANFKNNASLFDFATFDKNTQNVRLSEKGKTVLADLIKELQ